MFLKRSSAKAISIAIFQRLTRCLQRLNNPIKSDGSALITAMILVVVIAMIAVAGTKLIMTSYNNVRHQQHQGAEVDNVARAGLVDAISWFKGQPQQPVCSPQGGPWADAAFNPQYSTSAVLCATIDTSIGLVQEYPINPALGIYGRYEVCRQTNPAVAGVVIDSYAVHDITGQRYFNGATTGQGYAWYIGSKGYIYKASTPWFTCNGATSTFKMHNVIARSLVSTEIRRLTLNNPTSPVLIINKPAAKDATVDQRGTITGEGQATAGIMYTNDGVNPLYLVNGGSVTQPTSTYAVPPASGTVTYVLGVSTSDLKLMANYVVTNVNQLPCPLPSLCLTYISGNAEFGASNQLFSSGILFVDGNLTLDSDAYCCYQGLIYCTGTVTVNDSNIINGCVICSGLYLGKAGAAESSQIAYSKSFLSTVRTVVCQYREMKSTYRVFTGIQGF